MHLCMALVWLYEPLTSPFCLSTNLELLLQDEEVAKH